MSWSRPLATLVGPKPIVTPDGKTLRTLKEAAEYLLTIPETSATQYASDLLLKAADEGGPYPMFARAAVHRAISGDEPAPTGKDKRAKKSDAWKERRKAWKAAQTEKTKKPDAS